MLLKYPVKEGESWESKTKIGPDLLPIKCTVGKFAQVEVPAGKFKAIPVRVETEQKGMPVISENWFAPNVGIVQQKVEVGGMKIDIKLTKFEKAKQ